MMWNLPTFVEIDEKEYNIRNKCDYRVVLDVISALNDEELEIGNRIRCALFIFYEDLTDCTDFETATKEMMKIVNNGDEESEQEQSNKPQLMDWQHDFSQLAPPISRVLGYSVRDSNRYTHWYDFVGAYMEIGECTFSNMVSIRSKRQKGKKLEKWEEDFYRENRSKIDLPQKYSREEKDFFDNFLVNT